MSKRKGVSADEKRSRMLELLHDKQEFFQLKELEKIAPKEKGIVAQSVKDVVQALVDDGLVQSERIGSSVYYWAYPDQAEHALEKLVEKQAQKITDISRKIEETQMEIEKEKEGKDPSDERTQLLQELSEVKSKVEELARELKKHEDNDPVVWAERAKQAAVAKDAANRWTDNVFAITSWVKSKFSVDEQTINKQFGIPENFDYVN